jgi:hypothetical protein
VRASPRRRATGRGPGRSRQARACTGASAGAHEHSGDTSPSRPFSDR